QDTVHGLGYLIPEETDKKQAIYRKDRFICFVDELQPGVQLQLLGDEFIRHDGGGATLMNVTGKEGRYKVMLDCGDTKTLRLDCEPFRLIRSVSQTY
ncbi:unnamed protein product, partial [Choristocarpus tenellus]